MVRLILMGLLMTMSVAWTQNAGAQNAAARNPGAQDTVPVLRIETGAHEARTNDAAIDAAGRILVTASDDKTARVWSLPEVRLLSVLRPPSIGAADEGKLYAVAVAPNGLWAAVSGWTSRDGLQETILIFDLTTGQVTRRLEGLPNVAVALAVSADGTRLAAGLGGANGIRAWNTATWRQVFSDANYTGRMGGLAFAPDGRLAAASYDGSVRLYAPIGNRLLIMRTEAGQRPYQIAFTPNGSRLAIGFQDTVAVEVRDGTTLAPLARPDVAGLKGNGMPRVAWSADGATLLAAGDVLDKGLYPVFAWGAAGAGPRRIADAGFGDATFTIRPFAGTDTALVSSRGDIALLNAAGRRTVTRAPLGQDLNRSILPTHATRRLSLARDGAAVGWLAFDAPDRWLRFDAAEAKLTTGASLPPDLLDWAAQAGETRVTDWDDNTAPKLNGRPLGLDQYERSESIAVMPDKVLLGANYWLRLFNASGALTWRRPVPGTVWRVNQSADGRLAVAAFADRTIRWHRMSDGQELLALFVTADAKRWIAFTPSGYYTASPGGEDLIGWHVSRGVDKAADFFSASRFRDRFHRPDVVTRVLATLDEGVALKQADLARGTITTQAAPIVQDLPPVVTILSPAEGATLSGEEASIGYSVRSPSGKPVRAVRVLIDGRPIPATRGLGREEKPNAQGEVSGQVVVPVPAGRTVEVTLIASTETHVSEPARRRLSGVPVRSSIIPAVLPGGVPGGVPGVVPGGVPGPVPGTGPAVPVKPVRRAALYALVIGVADYAKPSLKLDFAGKDARDIAALLERQKGGLYRDVQVRLLEDRKASREAVLDGLDWLRRSATAEDVAVLFLAGHGTNDATGRFWFLPADVDTDRLRATAVSGTEIKEALGATAGRVVAFLDACHSGNVLGSGFRSAADMDRLSNELSAAEVGLVVFVSSTGRELSRELSEMRNGAFTAALLEAASGHADTEQKGAVTLEELNFFVLQRVKVLTKGEQHPNMLRPGSIRDFPLLTVGRP